MTPDPKRMRELAERLQERDATWLTASISGHSEPSK